MRKTKPSTHDAFFKALLEDIERAKVFLSRLLPGELTGHFDMDTLTREESSFISPSLKTSFSDGLFSVRLKERGDEYAMVAVLLEHKSYPDKWVTVQMLGYIAEGYRVQAEKIKSLAPGNPSPRHLRPIIPFLFYHGAKKWRLRPLEQLFAREYSPFLRFVPTFEPAFTSLPEMPDVHIARIEEGWLEAALLTQKYSHNPLELENRLIQILRRIHNVLQGNFLQIWSVYFSKSVSIAPEVFTQLIENLPSDINPDVMISLYDQLLEKGRRKGLEQGLEQGLGQGLEQGLKEGLQLGMREGLLEGNEMAKKETILVGYKNGISIEVLCLQTGYSKEMVWQILFEEGLA